LITCKVSRFAVSDPCRSAVPIGDSELGVPGKFLVTGHLLTCIKVCGSGGY